MARKFGSHIGTQSKALGPLSAAIYKYITIIEFGLKVIHRHETHIIATLEVDWATQKYFSYSNGN